jgi:ATP-binding cassette subfamily B protein
VVDSTVHLKARYVLRRIVAYCYPYRWALVVGLLGILLTQALAVVIPEILRVVIDRGVTQRDKTFMLEAGGFVIFLGLLRGLAGFAGRYYNEAVSHKAAYDIRNALYAKVQDLPFVYHDRARTGSLITRGISDVDEVQRFLAFGVLDGLNTLFIIVFAVGAMFYISPVLAMIAMLPMLPLFYKSYAFARFVEVEWKKVMEHLSNLGNQLQETLVGSEVVRAFAREPYEIEKFSQENDLLYQQHLKVINEWTTYIPFSAIMSALSSVLVIIVGGWLESRQYAGVTVGVIVQFNAYILLMAQPIRFFGFVIMAVNQGIASGRRVFEVLDEPLTLPEKPDAIPLPPIQGIIQFEGVSLRYREDLPFVLHQIDLVAKPDQVIAIIGKTGAGKSSLVNLIPRFYEVSQGCITIDGYNLQDVTLSSLRRQIGVVLQESLLFSATVRENIALGRPDASEEEIIAAAKAANAHGFICEFPNGYDTRVGERGITLSGGQRQRVAIARALLIDPRILILDDATSSVDTETETLIQQALARLMRGRTTFIVAQRLASVVNATQILVLDEGRIVERGNHEQLLALRGVYKEIYDLQLADQERVRRETLAFEHLLLKEIA